MTITAVSGPIVQFGTTLTSTAGTGLLGNDMEHNEQRAPAMFDLGVALMDPRVAYQYDPGGGVSSPTIGFYRGVGSVDYVPATANTSAFVVNTASSGTTTFTLAAASSANGTFLTTIIAPETGKQSETLLCIDSTAAFLNFGSTATGIAVWNPGAGTGRNVTIKPSSNLDAGTFTIVGRDMYGFKITETCTAGSTNLSSKKTYKYISSIVNTTTPTSTGILIGFGDTFGFPLLVPYTGQNAVVNILASAFSSAVQVALSSATVVLGSTAATQTSTTPDVRGTYASTTASNGTVRLQMTVTPAASAAAAITSTSVAGFFGVTQFSSV